MGIYGQPNSWQCGPFALKHALLAYGVFAHEDELARIAGSSDTRGTDEKGLHRAARRHGCTLRVMRHASPTAARRELAGLLQSGVPVLLCVDQWEHWVTAVSAAGNELVVFDSHYAQPLRLEGWDAVIERLAYRQRRWRGLWNRTVFDLQPLVRQAAGFRLRLSPEEGAFLLRPENATLAARLDELARRVLELAVAPGRQLEFGFALDRFIATRRDTLLDRAARISAVDSAAARRVTDDLAFVARVYGAVLRPEAEPHAVEALARLVAERAPARDAAGDVADRRALAAAISVRAVSGSPASHHPRNRATTGLTYA